MAGTTDMAGTNRRPPETLDRRAVLAVFLVVIGLTYTDDVVAFAFAGAGSGVDHPRWIVSGVEGAVVISAALLKWRLEARARPGETFGWKEFAPLLWRSWWPLGATLVVAVHAAMGILGSALWVGLIGSVLFAIAMSLVLLAALDVGPTDDLNPPDNTWILPLVGGTLMVQIASALWFPVINLQGECADTISSDFFFSMSNVIPMLLITLGIETGYLRRTQSVHTPGQKAVSILTVVMLCIAQIFSFSMLTATNRVVCGLAATLHEFAAFVVCVQATSIALGALVWLLLAERDPIDLQDDA